jgi:16S rRNA (adenine1518-N6/adenine1519-N6)-dimethyltransferase
MANTVRAKKHLGQHFLKTEAVAENIANTIVDGEVSKLLEIGPGMGVLTKYLMQKQQTEVHVCEIDTESVFYLEKNFPGLHQRIIPADFLQLDLTKLFDGGPFGVTGNFPYNISSQILFKVWENYDRIPVFSGMFQKEVAERVCAKPGSKTYGILSVLLQSTYDLEYLFTVGPEHFNPPPKVQSGVMRMTIKPDYQPVISHSALKEIVKLAFNQRRKTLRNALKSMQFEMNETIIMLLTKRAEQLDVDAFITLAKAKIQ